MAAKRFSDSRPEHFIATADDRDCKNYFHMLELKQSSINKVVDQCQPRLRLSACVHTKGPHFAHLLN